MPEPLLKVEDLIVTYPDGARAVDGVSFALGRARALGVVGESGSGKSTLACAIPRLLPGGGRIAGGRILVGGEDVAQMTPGELRRLRGGRVGMAFQDASAALDPLYTVGFQLGEAMGRPAGLRPSQRRARRERAAELLAAMGIDDPRRRLGQYPRELSGGMRQRAMLAIAMARDPELLVLDEPTAALDATVQAQILELLRAVRERGASILVATHDMGVVAGLCDEVLVLYAGRVCERGPAEAVLADPRHEYTRALLRCAPGLSGAGRLQPIPGAPPDPRSRPRGCAFAPRCARAMRICLSDPPPEAPAGEGRFAACWQAVRGGTAG